MSKEFMCIDCNTEFDTKPDRCPKCRSDRIRKKRYFTEFRVQVREKNGKRPVQETVTKQRIGRNGKLARVLIAVDRTKKHILRMSSKKMKAENGSPYIKKMSQ